MNLIQQLNSLESRFETCRVDIAATAKLREAEIERLEMQSAILEKSEKARAVHKDAIRLCEVCTGSEISVKTFVEEIATKLLNALAQGVAEQLGDTSEPVPEYAYVIKTVTDDRGVVVGLDPILTIDGEESDIEDQGTGISNLISMTNRLVYLLLSVGVAPILIMDEPMTNLSTTAWQIVVDLLDELCEQLDLQIIVVTHSGVHFPNTYEVALRGKYSIVSKISTRD